MNSTYGTRYRVSVFGESHGQCVGALIEGIPAGLVYDRKQIFDDLARRQGGNALSTSRKEADTPQILSGMHEDVFTGAPVAVIFENADTRSSAYSSIKDTPRPSHADFTALKKFGGSMDMTGGGPFSARFTAALVFAGAVAKTILKKYGITVDAVLSSVMGEDSPEKIKEIIAAAKAEGDSVGGIISCTINGLHAGIGEPHFAGLENKIASAVFGVPAVKGIEFGAGFSFAQMKGSEANDAFCTEDGEVVTSTNNNGGVLGGISNGMPVTFRVAMKPTPSIAKPQKTVNIKDGTETVISVGGRHDPCVALRAVPVIESAAAIAVCDLML